MFYFVENLCFFLKIFKFLYFQATMIYEILEVMMSINEWDRVHFWIYILNRNSRATKLGQLTDTNRGNKFQESFERFIGLGLIFQIEVLGLILQTNFQVFFNLPNCFSYPLTNFVKIPVFHFVEKKNKGHLKLVNVNY